ncbi:hypothetical protein RND71_044212 [Anisodus tanguticus]|uniref:Uncharacterized protein n=1 Tax=Anisodus tanguticus TaxID=243964 RepID=A0AAE1UMU4_9SOLA|nr:hypothetical protein RND71_044212 [Anisodus tanguticus]
MQLASNFPDVASSAAPQAAANHANQMTRSFSNSLDYKEREAWKPLDFIIKGEELKEEGNKDPFSLEQGQEVSSLDGWLPRELVADLEDIRGSSEWRFPCREPDEGRPSRPIAAITRNSHMRNTCKSRLKDKEGKSKRKESLSRSSSQRSKSSKAKSGLRHSA